MPTEAPRENASKNKDDADYAKFLLFLASSSAILATIPLLATDWKSFAWSTLFDARVATWSMGTAGAFCFAACVQARKLGWKSFVSAIVFGAAVVAFMVAMFVQGACKRAEMASVTTTGHSDVAQILTALNGM